MPMSQSSYSSPNTGAHTGCSCFLSTGDEVESEHSGACAVSKKDFADLRAQMDFGSSLQSFAHEWDAAVTIERSPEDFDPSRDVADHPQLIGHLVAALLEEQRTANLVAIASSPTFHRGVRRLAHDAVIDRLDVNQDLANLAAEGY